MTRRVPTERTFQELIEILTRCGYNEFRPFVEKTFPENLDLAKWDAVCARQGIELIPTTREDFEALFLQAECVLASTAAACSLAGRVEEMREQMIRAEAQGRARKAKGFLVTDFADACAWQPLAVSMPGLVMGGAFAVSGAKSSQMDLERALDGVFEAPLGGLLLRLGTLYLRGGAVREQSSEFYHILSREIGYSRHPGLTQAVLEDISGIVQGVRVAAERWAAQNVWAQEIVYAANLLNCACHRRNEAMLRALRDEHGRVWRRRFESEGRLDSLARLPRF